jgi:type II secretory pathway component PulM
VETHRREHRTFGEYSPVTAPGATGSPRWQQAGAIAKTATSVFGAISLIVMAGIFLASYRDIPERTKQNQENIATLRGSVDSVRSEMRDVKTLLAQSLCLQMSEKRHTDWQSCFIQAGPLSVVGRRTP